MRSRLLSGDARPRRFVLVFEPDDEVVPALEAFAAEQKVAGANLAAIGAFRQATLAWWNPGTREYEHIPVAEQVEVTSLTGNIAIAPDGEGRKVHIHCVLGRRDGSTVGGHLIEARVGPTLELVLCEEGVALRREQDADTGLALLVP